MSDKQPPDWADILQRGQRDAANNAKACAGFTGIFTGFRALTEVFEENSQNQDLLKFSQTASCWGATASLGLTLLSVATLLYIKSIMKRDGITPKP